MSLIFQVYDKNYNKKIFFAKLILPNILFEAVFNCYQFKRQIGLAHFSQNFLCVTKIILFITKETFGL